MLLIAVKYSACDNLAGAGGSHRFSGGPVLPEPSACLPWGLGNEPTDNDGTSPLLVVQPIAFVVVLMMSASGSPCLNYRGLLDGLIDDEGSHSPSVV